MKTKAAVLGLMLSLFTSSLVLATPGDVACSGSQNGKKIDLLLGYDVHGQDEPSLMQVSEDGKVVFESQDISLSIEVFVGDPNNPVIESIVWEASDEESTALVRSPYEHSDPFTVRLSVNTDSGLFSASDLEMTCNL